MLNITIRDKIRNTEIRKQTQVKDIMVKIKEAKWRWAGHLMRRDDNRWTRRVTEWQPRNGKRTRGRQKSRWRDDLTTYMGPTWTRLAQDRLKTIRYGKIMKRATFRSGWTQPGQKKNNPWMTFDPRLCNLKML